MKTKVSLMDCQNARYPVPPAEYIYCKAGQGLPHVHKRRVDRSRPLIIKVCQQCHDFIDMNDGTETLEALELVAVDNTEFTPEQKYPLGTVAYKDGVKHYYVKIWERE